MEIVISGICCWVDAPQGGKTVIIRNALNGGVHENSLIPSHYAFIHAKRDQVDETEWPGDWGNDEDVLFWLTGDRVTIDPMPPRGAIDISMLPHVASGALTDPICPNAEEIRPGYRDEPVTERVLALLDVPPNTEVTSGTTERGAAFAALRIPSDPVTITATPFEDSLGRKRSLKILHPDAQVFIVNVNMPEYITGIGARDDDHKYLVCEIFRPRAADHSSSAGTSPAEAFAKLADVVPPPMSGELCGIGDGGVTALHYAAGRAMTNYLNTLAAGCSASQWP